MTIKTLAVITLFWEFCLKKLEAPSLPVIVHLAPMSLLLLTCLKMAPKIFILQDTATVHEHLSKEIIYLPKIG